MTDGEQLLAKLKNVLAQTFEDLEWPADPRGLYAPARYAFAVPGKQIRPLLSLFAAGMVSNEYKRAIPAARSVEVLHTFTLVHDDIMDQAEKRRGQSSVYHKWDTSTAILSGDVIFAKAMQCLLPYGSDEFSEIDKSRYQKMQSLFLDGITEICEGQAMDMAFSDQEEVTLSDYLQMIDKKTAALLSISLELGGLAAGANESETKFLAIIGREAGLAFQIQDDLLDIKADSSTSGKVRGGDLREGKMTYLIIEALKRAEAKDKEWLKSALGNRTLSEADVQKAFDLFEALHIVEDVEAEIRSHYKNALTALDSFEDSLYKSGLNHLLDHLITRSY
jgi:geranylgeranyl diphosphate synthase type II